MGPPLAALRAALLAALLAAFDAALLAAFDAAARCADAAAAWRWRLAAPFFLRWGDPFGWGRGPFPGGPGGGGAFAVEAPGGETCRLVAAFVYLSAAVPQGADWRRAAAAAGLAAPPPHFLHFWGGGGAAASVAVDPAASSLALLSAEGPLPGGPPSRLTGYSPRFLLQRARLLAGAAPRAAPPAPPPGGP